MADPRTSAAEQGERRGSIPDVILPPIIGASAKMQRVLKLVARVAPTESTVLVVGESGTGKELVARSLHLLSPRAQGPFIAINVGAIPEALLESEMFGHARGAFTGASTERMGLFEAAEGGTVFLDEIGEMPMPAQVRLLRTLDDGEVRRIGENVSRRVNVRVVAATHRDLRALIAQGRFREDLYFRLNVVQIDLPPLRERREDIGLLASYFLERVARELKRPQLRFTPEAMAVLEKHDYPGNVRELENAVQYAAILSNGDLLTVSDLPVPVRMPRMLPEPAPGQGAPLVREPAAARPSSERDAWSLEDVTREHVLRVLTLHRGNATAAARQLGLSRTTLWRMLKRWQVARAAVVGS